MTDLLDRFDTDRIADGINRAWDTYSAVLTVALMIVLPVAAAVVVWLLLRWARRSIQALRKVQNVKMHVGFAIVQAAVTFAVVTGVYEGTQRLFDVDPIHAVVYAAAAEAAVWVAVGRIWIYSRNHPGQGVGLAGRLFWIVTIVGAGLAAAGSSSVETAFGRVLMVVIGTALWWERIREWVPAPTTRSQWRWTPRRLLISVGAISPEDADLDDDGHEWQVRRLTRAMWRANSRSRFWAWLGNRALGKRSATANSRALADARRRFADGWVLRQESAVDSQLMSAVIDEAERAAKFAAMSPNSVAANWPTATGQPPGQSGDSPAVIGRRVAGQDSSQAGQRGRSTAGAAAGQAWTAKRRRNAEKAAAILDRQPDISGAELAKRLKLSTRSGQRARNDAAILAGVGHDEAADKPAAVDRPSSNGHAAIDPATVADMAAAGDRT